MCHDFQTPPQNFKFSPSTTFDFLARPIRLYDIFLLFIIPDKVRGEGNAYVGVGVVTQLKSSHTLGGAGEWDT